MRECINSYLNEIFDEPIPELSVSELRMEASIEVGGKVKGSFFIESTNHVPMKGFLAASSARMHCLTKELKGTSTEVLYEFNGVGMELGNVVKGDFHIVSNAGEICVPFVVSVDIHYPQSSLGEIKNLFLFTNLAKSSWQEALKVFRDPRFRHIFANSDKQYLITYEGLRSDSCNNQNLEEFLISVHKKEKIKISVSEGETRIEDFKESLKKTLTITKNQWGYVEIAVSTDTEFIKLSKEKIGTENFVGSVCPFEYVIEEDKIHFGNNYGRIWFETIDQKIEIPILVIKKRKDVNNKILNAKRTAFYELLQYYLEFRTNKCSSNIWIKNSITAVDRIRSLDDSEVFFKLYKAQLLIADKKKEDAEWILKNCIDVKDLKRSAADYYAYYLYLNTMLTGNKDQIDKAAHSVEELYRKDLMNWRLLWLRLYLNEELHRNIGKKFLLIEEFCGYGCRNPIIYAEAYKIIQQNPALLIKLKDFELKILFWAAKNNQITQDVAEQIVYLAAKYKTFHPILHKILAECYLKYPTSETVTAICGLLIKGNRTDCRYFKWYEIGVRLGIKVTRLYEYYVLSSDFERKDALPKIIFMYFIYNNNLDYKHKGFLYRNLLEHKESYEEICRNYQKQMEQFVKEQLLEQKINDDLAFLYQNLLREHGMSDEEMQALSKLLFKYKITVRNKKIKSVKVLQSQIEGMQEVFFTGNEACIDLYTEDYAVFFRDAEGNCYHERVEFEILPLLKREDLVKACMNHNKENLGLILHMCIGKNTYLTVHDKNIESVRVLVEARQIKETYKKDLRIVVAEYYYERNRMIDLDSYLMMMNYKEMDTRDRARAFEFMLKRGMYESAYQFLQIYGFENINRKLLVRLCSRKIAELDFEFEDELLALCSYVFEHGKYNEELLKYLACYYQGSTKSMQKIWMALKQFEVESYDFEERILIQLMFTHSYVEKKEEIFASYCESGPRVNIERAYLTYNAYEYFVSERITEKMIFERITFLLLLQEELGDVCKLAFLKYYSEKETYSNEEKQLIVNLLEEFLFRNIYFEFFKLFHIKIESICQLNDKTILEYRTNSNNKVLLHYIFEDYEKETEIYVQEEMKNAYGGIFTKEFILFFGDILQYYITEKAGAEESLTESKRIAISDIQIEGKDNKYDMLNDMLVSLSIKDETTLLELMSKYLQEEYISNRIFTAK